MTASMVGYRIVAFAFAFALAAVPGCSQDTVIPAQPSQPVATGRMPNLSRVDKIDLLLVIDNSRSMADKQKILERAIPDLVRQLVGTDELEPIRDMHIGVVSSSLGGHGADACNAQNIPSENDRAWLINRAGTGANDGSVEGWNGSNFLVWDPSSDRPSHTPQGEADLDALVADMATMVGGVGEIGCGYEAPLEAWYRFLIEPDPHQDITIEAGNAVLSGTDSTLLAQRAEFLRPDSLLAIIMLSDENDCSIRDGGQFYLPAQIYAPGTNTAYHLPKPRAACATDPNDPCCRSCAQPAADGCDTSQDDCDSGPLDNWTDNINLRCFDQKRRFGVDFLWPIDRYVAGVTATQVQDRHGNIVPNPLFSDLNPQDDNHAIRSSGLVIVAGIVGVPWQDIARKSDGGAPDLLAGLDETGAPKGGFQSAGEMSRNDTWAIILGDPDRYLPPTDPLMAESITPRSGSNPVTGDALQPPGSGPLNPINGSEYSIPNNDDLQYACIFDLVDDNLMSLARDCTDPNQTACECSDPNNDSPLCSTAVPTTQLRAKAYPGRRQLSVLRDLYGQGVVGSICPEQMTDPSLRNFGYRPAIDGIVTRMRAAMSNRCVARGLLADEQGRVACHFVEARQAEGQACFAACNAPGRRPAPADHPAVLAAKGDELAASLGFNCFCELVQTEGEDRRACQNDVDPHPVNQSGEEVHGWCYVDATATPPLGNPEVVASCPDDARAMLRFVGDAEPVGTVYYACAESALPE